MNTLINFCKEKYLLNSELGYANSTANPMIYPLFNRDFRRAFVKLVCRTKRLVYCLGSYDPKTPSPCSTGRRYFKLYFINTH